MKKLLFALVVILLLIGAVAAYFAYGSYSEGFRAGTVVKLSRKGVGFKTYEGQLNLGLVLSDGNPGANAAEVSNIWEFSVLGSDTAVLRQLEAVMLSGQRTKLHYAEKFVKLPWRGDTRYLVNGVEVLALPDAPKAPAAAPQPPIEAPGEATDAPAAPIAPHP